MRGGLLDAHAPPRSASRLLRMRPLSLGFSASVRSSWGWTLVVPRQTLILAYPSTSRAHRQRPHNGFRARQWGDGRSAGVPGVHGLRGEGSTSDARSRRTQLGRYGDVLAAREAREGLALLPIV